MQNRVVLYRPTLRQRRAAFMRSVVYQLIVLPWLRAPFGWRP